MKFSTICGTPNILLIHNTRNTSPPGPHFRARQWRCALDHFLTQRAAQLSIDTRLNSSAKSPKRQIRHDKHAIHGALSPQSILVFEPNAEVPRLKLYNWQTAFRTSATSTSGLPQVTPTAHPDVFWEDISRSYLAPELVNDPTLRGEHVDVFSLGAIAYHIFSGQPPAGSSLELAEKPVVTVVSIVLSVDGAEKNSRCSSSTARIQKSPFASRPSMNSSNSLPT
jgi:serine/threonine protein kinase